MSEIGFDALRGVLTDAVGPDAAAATIGAIAAVRAGVLLIGAALAGGEEAFAKRGAATGGSPIAGERARAAIPPGAGEATGTAALAVWIGMQHLILSGWGNLTDQQRAVATACAAVVHNVACVCLAGLPVPRRYEDFAEVLGASGGSSIAGGGPGSPWIGQNPFQNLMPIALPAVQQSVECGQAILALRRSDPALYPLAPVAVAAYLQSIGNGMVTHG